MTNILSEMNAVKVASSVAPETVAVLIFGACENHGNHMPFGADFIMPFELATRVARRYDNLIVCPPVPFGMSSHNKDFQMTLSLEPETMVKVIQDLLQSLINNNIKRVLIINGHDGNIAPIELASRTIKAENADVIISCLESWWTLVGQLDNQLFEVWNGSGHGGEAETSAMLAIRPDLVDMTIAPEQIIPKLPEFIRIFWQFNELTDTGATGAPGKATPEKGRKIMEVLENALVNFLAEMDSNNWKYGKSIA